MLRPANFVGFVPCMQHLLVGSSCHERLRHVLNLMVTAFNFASEIMRTDSDSVICVLIQPSFVLVSDPFQRITKLSSHSLIMMLLCVCNPDPLSNDQSCPVDNLELQNHPLSSQEGPIFYDEQAGGQYLFQIIARINLVDNPGWMNNPGGWAVVDVGSIGLIDQGLIVPGATVGRTDDYPKRGRFPILGVLNFLSGLLARRELKISSGFWP
ncbi:hypothetical protein DFH07DRAFT_779482 [Mycena maculata]|uniref:Uncharacterized protein n=1 Tax=Mycena maculata TaxID=230809 RepID=A0AAD7MYZ6_9AGAR|nr:hypothetical protein DFH07DRAFT_779482 [Mycena maculata]